MKNRNPAGVSLEVVTPSCFPSHISHHSSSNFNKRKGKTNLRPPHLPHLRPTAQHHPQCLMSPTNPHHLFSRVHLPCLPYELMNPQYPRMLLPRIRVPSSDNNQVEIRWVRQKFFHPAVSSCSCSSRWRRIRFGVGTSEAIRTVR